MKNEEHRPAPLIDEEEKPKIVKNLESAFKDALWEPDRPFDLNDNDMHLMFDAINDGMFGNQLDRGIPKFTLKAELIPSGPVKYRCMEHALAAFASGCVKGDKKELIFVRQPRGQNFYVAVCALMHEMIHMFDYHYGPMGRQFEKWGAVAQYDLNYPFADPVRGLVIPPSNAANLMNLAAAGFMDPAQLPDEVKDKVLGKAPNDHRPRQYQLPGRLTHYAETPDTHERIPQTEPLPMKYRMDDLDGFYDVHGDFFMNIARLVNAYGFGVSDVFDKETPTRMTKTYEAEGRAPDPAEAALAFFKTDEHKASEWRDAENWFVEIA